MRTIAIHIQKGGVGKTTLSGNIAYALAKKGRKTLMVDCDPQANLSSWFISNAPQYELADILTGKVEAEKTIIELKPNLFIIPTFGIDGGLKSYSEGKLIDEPFIFDDLKDEVAKLGFDTMILDLSPGMSRLEKCAILSCDEVITPLTPEFFSLDGIDIFHNELKKINKAYRKDVKHTKIVINNMNHSFKRHKLIVDKITAIPNFEFFYIGQDSKIAESQLKNQTIFEYFSASKTIPEIEKLAQSIGA